MEVYRIQNVFSFATKEESKLKTSEAIQASINDSSQVLGVITCTDWPFL